jgi:hypothetical protein
MPNSIQNVKAMLSASYQMLIEVSIWKLAGTREQKGPLIRSADGRDARGALALPLTLIQFHSLGMRAAHSVTAGVSR